VEDLVAGVAQSPEETSLPVGITSALLIDASLQESVERVHPGETPAERLEHHLLVVRGGSRQRAVERLFDRGAQ
jgi:hypothetical protein